MKYKYYYNNGKIKEHTKLVERKTIEREKGEATKVDIYEVHTLYITEEIEKYVTTLSLQ